MWFEPYLHLCDEAYLIRVDNYFHAFVNSVCNSFTGKYLKPYFMYVNVLPTCVHVYHMYDWYLSKSEKGTGSSGTLVIEDCEPPPRYWETWSSARAAYIR